MTQPHTWRMRRLRLSSFDRLHVCPLNRESSGGGRARRLARGLISERFDKSSGPGRKKETTRSEGKQPRGRVAKEAASKSAIYSISQYSRPSRSPSSPTPSESLGSISGGETCVQLLQDPVLKCCGSFPASLGSLLIPFSEGRDQKLLHTITCY